jgi:hypothetical protein
MTNPAQGGGEERPPPVPDPDPLPVDEVPPPAMPPPPEYDTTGRLEPTPAYDALAAESPLTDPLGAPSTSGAESAAAGAAQDALTGPLPPVEPATTPAAGILTPEADYALAPNPTDAGPLGQVKALAADKPAAFLGAALAAGWLLGKIMSRGGERAAKRRANDDD